MARLTQGGRSTSDRATSSQAPAGLPLQTKLRMGRAGDAFEQEADRVADRVVSSPAADQVARQAETPEEDPLQASPLAGTIQRLAQRQPMDDQQDPPVQAQEEEEDQVQTQEEEEEQVQAQEEEEEQPLQSKDEEEEESLQQKGEEEEEAIQAQQDEKEETLQPRIEEEEPATARARPLQGRELSNPDIERRLMASKGNGFPLEADIKREMEDKFGTDFSAVRIHADAEAADLARKIHAQAFTHGNDIYFNQGRYDPATTAGKRLLAHELTHVVQQTGVVRRQPDTGLVQRADGAPPARLEVSRGDYRGAAIDPTATTPTLEIPKVSIPNVKARHGASYGNTDLFEGGQKLRVRRGGRGQTDQRPNWTGDPAITGAAERAVQEKTRQAENRGSINQNRYFFRARGNRDMILFAERARLLELFKIPTWDRQGKFRNFHVDHVVEHQVGGLDGIRNYELLDGPTNSSSGARLNNQINTRIRGALTALRNEHPSNSNIPRPSRAPYVRSNYQVEFNRHDFNLPVPNGRNRALYWTKREIERRQPANQLEAVPQREMDRLFDPAAVWFFTTREGGTRLRRPNAPRDNWLPQVKYVDWQPVANPDVSPSDVSGALRVLFFNRANRRYPIRAEGEDSHSIPIRKIDGFAGGYIDREGLTRGMRRILRFRGLSPIEIEEARIDGARGLYARGRILPTVPFIRDADIQLVIHGEEIQLQKTFTLGEVRVPPPFQLTDTSLTVFYSSSQGFGVDGEVNFEIQRLGTGRIAAAASQEGGFALEGEFNFDPALFDSARVGVTYRNNEWGISGNIQIPRGKVPGIRSANIDVSYARETLNASGQAELDIPGVQSGEMSVTVAPQGWSIGGSFNLSPEIPGIRSGSVTASVSKTEGQDGYNLTARGTAVPDIPGITSNLTVEYANGAISIEANAQYDRGLLRGQIRVGATNRALDDEGNPTGDPTDTFLVFGGGELTVRITPWLEGTVGVSFLPNGEIVVSGRIGLPSSIEVFRRLPIPERELVGIGFDIPIFAIPVGPKSIGLKATISGGLRAYASIGPGRLEQLSLGITYNPDHPEQTHVQGGGRFVIPAEAGLKLAVRATIGLNAVVGGVDGGLEVAGGIALAAAAEADVTVDWTPTSGFQLSARLSQHIEPRFVFTIDGVIEAWALWYDKTWRWRLADYEYGSNMRFGVILPITYREGEPFSISFDDIEFQRPAINARSFLRGLINDIKGSRS